MSQGDGTPIDVDFVVINVQVAHRTHRHDCRLINLKQIDIVKVTSLLKTFFAASTGALPYQVNGSYTWRQCGFGLEIVSCA